MLRGVQRRGAVYRSVDPFSGWLIIFEIGQRWLEQHCRNVLQSSQSRPLYVNDEVKMREETDLLAVPCCCTHTQCPILDSARREMVEHDMVRNGEDRIIIQTSRWRVIPSW